MNRRRWATIAATCALLIALPGCAQRRSAIGAVVAGTATASVTTASVTANPPANPVIDVPAGGIVNADEANAAGDSLLALAPLPAGNRRLASSPSGLLPDTQAATEGDQEVDRTRWWAVPGALTGFTRYVADHQLAGWNSGSDGSDSGDAVVVATFTRDDSPVDPDLMGTPVDQAYSLRILAVPDGDHVDVETTVTVTWPPQRTAAEAVAASVDTAILDYTGPAGRGGAAVHLHVVLSPARVLLVGTRLNALVPHNEQGVACADGFGEQAVLQIRQGGEVLVFTDYFHGQCGVVDVTADGRAQTTLLGDDPLNAALYSVLGIRAPADRD
jgi:hypothetical protein